MSNEMVKAVEETVRLLEKMEKDHDNRFGWAEAGLLNALRHAWATYDMEKWRADNSPQSMLQRQGNTGSPMSAIEQTVEHIATHPPFTKPGE
jgi:hypothetical protein